MKPPRSLRGNIPSTSQVLNAAAAKLEAQGKKVLRMHIGAPSTGAPKAAIEAAIKAEYDDILGYTSAQGLMPLRERIAQHYDEQYGVQINPERVVVTVGASMALVAGAVACLEVGDKFCLPYPAYPAYEHTLKMLGVEPFGFSTSLENGFQARVSDLEQLETKPKAFIVASPSNPGGTILPEDELKKIAEYCESHGIQLFSDEIYHGIEYDGEKTQTALKFSDNAIVINSFSKYFSMPGWRIGWMVVPEDLINNCGAIIRNMYLAAPTPCQYAAIAAMDCRTELDEHLKRYAKNRDILLSEMPKAGFDKFLQPEGAFYFYAHVKHLHHDSHLYAQEILKNVGVAAMPGTDFDPHHGHHYMRFSYAGKTEDIEEAVKRLREYNQRRTG
jgi:aspartate/methionine/tyrosine aminotransferase